MTVHEVSVRYAVQVWSPGLAVTTVNLMGPPCAGAVQLTLTLVLPATPVTSVGVSGVYLPGVALTGVEAPDVCWGGPTFVAVTVNVYSMWFVSELTVQVLFVPLDVQLPPPALEVAVTV